MRHVPGHAPLTHLPDCHTAVEMREPRVAVVMREESGPGRATRRYVGMALQENGVRVEIRAIDVEELIADLMEARQWWHGDGDDPVRPIR